MAASGLRGRRAQGRMKHRNPVFRPLIKFSIYAAVCLILLFVLAARVGNLTPPTHHRDMYKAVLSNADSLVGKNDVKIAGVTVGQVHGVKAYHDKAIVTFSLDHNLRLRRGTAAGLRWQDIIGHKYLYLYPSTTGPFLPRGATLTNEVQGADVGDFLVDVGGFLRALNPKDINSFTQAIVNSLQDNEGQVGQLIENSASLSQNLAGQDTAISDIVNNLNATLSAIQARDSDLAQVIDHLSSLAGDLAARNDVIDNLIVNLTQVNGDLSQLVTQNGANVSQIASNLQTIATVLKQHAAELDADLATGPAGLAPYIEISKLGQWFAIRVTYSCLANEATCTYDQPANPPASLNNPPANPVPGSSVSSASASPEQPAVPGVLAPIGPPAPAHSFRDLINVALYGDSAQP